MCRLYMCCGSVPRYRGRAFSFCFLKIIPSFVCVCVMCVCMWWLVVPPLHHQRNQWHSELSSPSSSHCGHWWSSLWDSYPEKRTQRHTRTLSKTEETGRGGSSRLPLLNTRGASERRQQRKIPAYLFTSAHQTKHQCSVVKGTMNLILVIMKPKKINPIYFFKFLFLLCIIYQCILLQMNKKKLHNFIKFKCSFIIILNSILFLYYSHKVEQFYDLFVYVLYNCMFFWFFF